MLAELFAWWKQQIGDLAAPVLRRFATAEPDALLVAPDPRQPDGAGGLTILRRRQGQTETLAQLSAGADAEVLARALAGPRRDETLGAVIPRQPLVRTVTLPLAAEATLDRVLRYEMDRLTPFAPADVFYTHQILGTDRVRGSLALRLAILPRAWIAPLLERLSGAGVALSVIEAAGPDGWRVRLPVSARAEGQANRLRSARRLMLIAAGAMACALLALPVLRQSLRLAEVERRMDEFRPRVEHVEALRKRIATAQAGAGQVAQAHQRAADALTVLGVLTGAIPNDTWLVTLTLHQRRVVMEGRSAAAIKLINAMSADPHLRNPAFTAPVLRSDNGTENFTIQVEFEP